MCEKDFNKRLLRTGSLVNQKCPQCLKAENQSKEQAKIFTCQTCQTNFKNGSKIN